MPISIKRLAELAAIAIAVAAVIVVSYYALVPDRTPPNRLSALEARADAGDPEAQYELGLRYQRATDDLGARQAARWFQKAAEQGLPKAQNALAILLKNSEPPDYPAALKWFHAAADQDDQHATANLGAMYLQGLGVDQDTAEGLRWLERSAELGNAASQRLVGRAYFAGTSVTQDYGKAAAFLTLAVKQGDQEAAATLAHMYSEGLGVTRDLLEAGRLYSVAARGGVDGIASYIRRNHAYCHKDRRLEQPRLEACLIDAGAGDAEAQATVGSLYDTGTLVPQDKSRAFELFRDAARNGSARAQIIISKSYDEGGLVEPDPVEAYAWIAAAAAHDPRNEEFAETAETIRRLLEAKLDRAVAERARAKAADYVRRYASAIRSIDRLPFEQQEETP